MINFKLKKGQIRELFIKRSADVIPDDESKVRLVLLDNRPDHVDIGVVKSKSENFFIPENLKRILKTGLPCVQSHSGKSILLDYDFSLDRLRAYTSDFSIPETYFSLDLNTGESCFVHKQNQDKIVSKLLEAIIAGGSYPKDINSIQTPQGVYIPYLLALELKGEDKVALTHLIGVDVKELDGIGTDDKQMDKKKSTNKLHVDAEKIADHAANIINTAFKEI